jgi:hypothetical protein
MAPIQPPKAYIVMLHVEHEVILDLRPKRRLRPAIKR